MVRKTYTILVMILTFITASKAYQADLFSIDEARINDEISSLIVVENYISVHSDVTLSDLINSGNILAGILTPMAKSPSDYVSLMEPPLGIPSFVWGFCLGLPGVLVVYLVADEDKEETKKAFYGCLASTVASGACYLVYYIVIIAQQL